MGEMEKYLGFKMAVLCINFFLFTVNPPLKAYIRVDSYTKKGTGVNGTPRHFEKEISCFFEILKICNLSMVLLHYSY